MIRFTSIRSMVKEVIDVAESREGRVAKIRVIRYSSFPVFIIPSREKIECL